MDRPSAVRLFAPDHPQLAITVRAKIDTARNDLIAELGAGYARTWDDYNRRAGIIEGLRVALDIITQTDNELAEGSR